MNSKGFTLIELLVVISIIGILSSVVLVSLNDARNKAKDTAVKAALAQIRYVAEMCYDDSTGGTYASCDILDSVNNIGSNNGSAVVTGSVTVTGTPPAATAAIISSTITTDYCVVSNLLGAGGYWCVDSEGASKTSTVATCTSNLCP